MKFKAEIKIMPLKELLDPQGKAVLGGLKQLGLGEVADVRVGKHLLLEIEAQDRDKAYEVASAASEKLLANPVMEVFEINISQ